MKILAPRSRLCQLLSSRAPSSEDLKDGQLWGAAMREGMDQLLWSAMQQQREIAADHEFREASEANQYHQAAQFLRRRHACGQVLSALRRTGIPVLCMRGLAVSEPLYGENAPLRPQSDIDLLLSEARMLDAKQALWDIGFRPHQSYRNIYFRGDIMLDLHHEPLGMERIRAWQYLTPLRASDFFKYAEEGELAGEKALLVSPRVHLPYLCFHALKHSFERLIWLYDIALLANSIDAAGQWDEVLAGIREYRLQRPCYYALAYVGEYLGASVPERLLNDIRPDMGFIERRLFARHMNHEVIPYLAERLFARMQPDFSHRLAFWCETIYPRYEVRQQMAQGGCVKCNFIRKRLKQLLKAGWQFLREGASLLLVRRPH
ncbi:MAG: nucleotidyltransferase family protein [Mariprofundaceae bacterium]